MEQTQSLSAEDYDALCRVIWPSYQTPITLDFDLEHWRFQGFQFDEVGVIGSALLILDIQGRLLAAEEWTLWCTCSCSS